MSQDEVTPEHLYLNRRHFLKLSIFAATGAATTAAYRAFRPERKVVTSGPPKPDGLTSFEDITNYNNFYEFSTDKEAVASAARDWRPGPWSLAVDGLVENPLNVTDLAAFKNEERVYRFRCVEGWSMVIPWLGFSLADLIAQARPKREAKYVAFESYFDPAQMPRARWAGIPFPYVEGLRLDEAMHPLTLLATGLYGKPLPNQNGAPVRLVVPWKYGFKSIKSVVRITLTDKEPPTTWNIANAREYGFYSNVNPAVDHPRWSQAEERRIGESGRRPTLPFNGYAKDVEHLYAGMDLKVNF